MKNLIRVSDSDDFFLGKIIYYINFLFLVFALLMLNHDYGFAQPAQSPLATNAAPVKPNILLMLDTSGSMSDTNIAKPHVVQANGGWLNDLWSNFACSNFGGNLLYRSPINNEIYYDPKKRYQPGYFNNGNQRPDEPLLTTSFEIFLEKSPSDLASITKSSFTDICWGPSFKRVTFSTSNFNLWKLFGPFFGVDISKYSFYTEEVAGFSIVWPGTVLTGTGNSPGPFGTKSINRTDCANASYCTVDEERRNIANWNAYHSTRLLAAKTGIGAAFANQDNLFRLGYSNVTTTTASIVVNSVRDWVDQKTNFFTWLNGLSANGQTPLRLALDAAGKYFMNGPSSGSVGEVGDPYNNNPASNENAVAGSHLTCRRNHTILVTDGAWNDTFNNFQIGNSDNIASERINLHNSSSYYQYIAGDNSDPRSKGKRDLLSGSDRYPLTLSDVAHYYWSKDLRTTMANNASPGNPTDPPFWQNMTTHTAGFGTAGQLTLAELSSARLGARDWYKSDPTSNENAKLDDLIHAAHNGGGSYMQITDAQSFASQVGDLIGKIVSELLSQAGLAVSANELTASTKKFIPYYTSGAWWGNLKMQSMDDSGNPVAGVGDWQVVATDASGTPTGVTTIPAVADRKVFTMPTGTTTNSTAIMFKDFSGIDVNVRNYILGDRSLETIWYRKRASIMGDITNSTPTFIKNVSDFGYDKLPGSVAGAGVAYTTYMTMKKNRTEGVVFVGANDGMLHGFRENGGAEVFAYVPRGVHGKISQLSDKAYVHQYFVDGPISEVDAFISAPTPANSTNASSARWANLIVGSLGAGGRSVFTIDVTNPIGTTAAPTMTAKSVLWEYDSGLDSDVGYVMGEVQTGVTASGDWVAVFGNGPYSNSGKAYLYILNLSTGELLKKIATDNSLTGNGLGAVRLVRNDSNQVIGAYAGDLKGNVWRFNLSAINKTSWPTNAELFYTAESDAGVAQPISAAPEVFKVYQSYDASSVLQLSTKSTGGTPAGYMVTFGTGKLYDVNDQSDTSRQTAYGVWDKATFCVEVVAPATNPSCSVQKFSDVPRFRKKGDLTVTPAFFTKAAHMVPVTLGTTTIAPSGTKLGGIFYSTSASRAVVWASDRGWYTTYTKDGQRTIYPFKQFVDSVVVSSIIPRFAATSCDANTPEGMNLIINPLTGACPVRRLVDMNGDGKIDVTDDPSAILDTDGDGDIDKDDGKEYCGWVAAVTGPPVFIKKTVVDPVTKSKKIEASFLTPTGKRTMLFPNQSLAIGRRDWRQIFPRQ